MLQNIVFSVIFGILMFVWSFVYLNKSKDKINQSFLIFLSVILLWMVFSISNNSLDTSVFGLTIKTLYFYCMMNMSLFFLLFIYRLFRKKLDILFWVMVGLNTATLIARYFFPINYNDPTFWRLSHPIVAPLMSMIFSLPAVYALVLVVKKAVTLKDAKQKAQLRNLFIGIGIALAISVVSEYLLPAVFHINTGFSLMYVAILVFVLYMFIAIMKFKFLNIQSDYLFQKLFMNSFDGIAIIGKNNKIISINDMAKKVLGNESIEPGDRITDHIRDYDFSDNYKQFEVELGAPGHECYLSLSQHPIEPSDPDSPKLLMFSDITCSRSKIRQEKELLLEKTTVDQLTGLYNKQYILDYFNAEQPGDTREKRAVLFLDVDSFKSINDLYGHLAGDTVLTVVANTIRDSVPPQAKCIRFGGDEFIVIVDRVDLKTAYDIAETIRIKMNLIDFSRISPGLRITLSVGLVEGTDTVRDLIAKADSAMYESKTSGKNQTKVANS